MAALVGCSGWSYDDWVGRFYPTDLAAKKGDWFAYYSRYFGTVEVNSTFYHIPNEFMVKSWIEKARQRMGFEFSVKLPQIITHDSILKDSAEKAAAQAASFEEICVKPLAEAGLLGGVLVQLSPYFKMTDRESLGRLRALFQMLNTDAHRYAVEFRHRSWLNERGNEIASDAIEVLQEFKVANVIVDGPGFPMTRSLTAKHAYVRFHGRNYDIWFKDEKEDDYRINRYDYLYDHEQLSAWEPRLSEMISNCDRAWIYFNNHGRAKAVKNAFQMMDILGIPHDEKDIEIQDQMTLGGFT
ncbi:MAG: DUF72 domain-containing protein [Thermoplasmata archaeon]|jgi:uncharacterized protein YecE (DUF72 family)|nr:DUF72 domain-containing protein [Thermoplasmata archaeon]